MLHTLRARASLAVSCRVFLSVIYVHNLAVGGEPPGSWHLPDREYPHNGVALCRSGERSLNRSRRSFIATHAYSSTQHVSNIN